jgi:hypothetical protein
MQAIRQLSMDPKPKIIQISTNGSDEGKTCFYALDSNGDVWGAHWTRGGYEWVRVGSPFDEAE